MHAFLFPFLLACIFVMMQTSALQGKGQVKKGGDVDMDEVKDLQRKYIELRDAGKEAEAEAMHAKLREKVNLNE